jgi:sugar lactone lactonase YvrE
MKSNPVRNLPMKTLRILTLSSFASILSYFCSTCGYADNVYVAQGGSGTRSASILRYDSSGNKTVFVSGLTAAYGVALDATGNLYVTSDNALTKYSPNGQSTRLGTLLSQWDQAIACDANGSVFAASGGNILKFDQAGNQTTFVQGSSYGMTHVSGLAFDRSGNLFAGSSANSQNSIVKFDSLGHGTVFSTFDYVPTGLAFDQSGNLYVGNYTYGEIEKYDPNGRMSLFASFASGLIGPPRGLGFGSSGDLYVADGGTIQRFDPGGHGSIFASGLVTPDYLAVQIIPEASSSALLVLGSGVLLICHRRKQSSATGN